MNDAVMSDTVGAGRLAAGQAARIGWGATRLVAAGLVVLLILGAMLEAAGAAPSPGSYQNAFTAACRNHGGTPKRVRTRVVKCTLADGTVIECDFNDNPPACTQKLTGLPSSPVTDPFARPIDGNEQPLTEVPSSPVTDPFARPTAGNEQTMSNDTQAGGGVIRSASRGGEQVAAKHHGKHHRGGRARGGRGRRPPPTRSR